MSDEVKKAAELRAAAELVSSFVEGWWNYSTPGQGIGNNVELPWPAFEVLPKLTQHVLATVAADDDEPIDEAWLLSVGFAPGSMRIESSGPGPVFGLRVDPSEGCDGCMLTQVRSETPYLMAVNIAMPETRGQLRRLCQCLNIALTPIGQEAGK